MALPFSQVKTHGPKKGHCLGGLLGDPFDIINIIDPSADLDRILDIGFGL